MLLHMCGMCGMCVGVCVGFMFVNGSWYYSATQSGVVDAVHVLNHDSAGSNGVAQCRICSAVRVYLCVSAVRIPPQAQPVLVVVG